MPSLQLGSRPAGSGCSGLLVFFQDADIHQLARAKDNFPSSEALLTVLEKDFLVYMGNMTAQAYVN